MSLLVNRAAFGRGGNGVHFRKSPKADLELPWGPPPISQPTKYEIGLNLRSAKELGIEIPPSLLVQANEVIEWGYRGEPESDGARSERSMAALPG